MTIWCWIFGHKFYRRFGNMFTEDMTYRETDYCTRCGKRLTVAAIGKEER